MALTNEEYWAIVWQGMHLPVTVDPSFQNDRVIADALRKVVPRSTPQAPAQVIEIGCAPGKWLVFFAKELGYQVHGIELVPAAALATVKNMQLCGVWDAQIHVGDFFTTDIEKQFDVVLSLGFVEHFTEVWPVFLRQWAMVKPGGLLIVGVPRFRGLNHVIQWCVDRFLPKAARLLPKHNARVMDPDIFEGFAMLVGGEIILNERLGGFEPALFPAGQIRHKLPRVFWIQTIRALRWILRGHCPGYLLAAIRRKEG
jgi:SAM-dependent methyltransferase